MPEAIRNRADFEHFDQRVRRRDHVLGPPFRDVLALLAELGIAEETAIIVSADHGESFGENGSYAEHGHANVAVHRLRWSSTGPGLQMV